METTGAILEKIGFPLLIDKINLPPLKKGQVLVKLAYSGICHSQLNEINGCKGPDPYLPHTLGHEGSGKVIDIGEGVSKVKPHDHVVLTWMKGKGLEGGPTQYKRSGCTINSGSISTFLQYAIISENRVAPIPKNLCLQQAALLGCAFPTGAGIIFRQIKPDKGDSLIIFGMGGIGLSALLAAKFLAVKTIIAIDLHQHKLKHAQELGATHILLADSNITEKIKAICPNGVDFSIECAGNKKAMEAAFSIIKPGGLTVIAGNLPKGKKIEIDPFDLILGKQIIGSWGGSSQIDEDIAYYANLILHQDLDLRPLISKIDTLSNINTLLQKLSQGFVGRGLIQF